MDFNSCFNSSVWLYGALINSSVVSVETDESEAAVRSDTVALPSSLATVAFINPFHRRRTHVLFVSRIFAWQGHVLPNVYCQLMNFFQGTICGKKIKKLRLKYLVRSKDRF
jgi:hypothetical protein